jgi:hypothetical protein
LIKHWAQLGTLKRGIAPHVFLAGRTVFVQLLDKWLEREPQPFGVQTEASDDLRDAVAAWYSDRVSGANPCALPAVAIRTIDAWNQIAQADRSLILLIDDGLEVSAEQMADATENGHYVIYRTSAVHTSRNGGALPRLNRDALADELQKCGVETTEAWRISGDVGGSGVVLKRMLLGHGPEPTWSKGEGASELAPIVLVGSWDSKNTSDKEVVATLMGQSYEAVEALLRPWIKANDPLVRNNDGQWRVVGREDAWRWLAPFLTDTQISAFEDVALRVLSEINPRFDLPADQRVFAGMRGLVPTHSYRLRKAISESLCLISLRPAFSDGRGSPAISQRIVSKVFDLEGDWRLWASLDHCLVLLAEASPEVVLGALERDLLREVAETPKLFTQAGDDLFADCPHVQLMWSLEALLWDRTTVFRTIVVLARLAARDRGGNMSPRPMGVLRDAFLPWYPQCCMGADDRCRMLDRILAVEPLVGWNLLFELLPRSHDATSPNNRPRYRASEASHEDSEDDAAYRKQIDHVALRLLENVGDDEKRWDKLMGQLARLPQRVFDLVVDELVRRGNDLDEAALYRVWGLLCKIVREHRYFVKAQWLMSERRLVRLEGVIARFEPADPIRRHMWLFAEERPYLPGVNSSISLDEQLEALERTRVDALREVSKEGGVEKILEMAAKQSERQAARMGHMGNMR